MGSPGAGEALCGGGLRGAGGPRGCEALGGELRNRGPPGVWGWGSQEQGRASAVWS